MAIIKHPKETKFLKWLFNIITNIRQLFTVLYFEYYVKIASVVRRRKNISGGENHVEMSDKEYDYLKSNGFITTETKEQAESKANKWIAEYSQKNNVSGVVCSYKRMFPILQQPESDYLLQ